MFRIHNDSPEPLLFYEKNRNVRKRFCFISCLGLVGINTTISVIMLILMFYQVNQVYEELNNQNTTVYIDKIENMIKNACVMIPGICDID